MTWVVYILKCGDDSLYTGITNDLDRRLTAHRRGSASRYTRSRQPVELAWSEPSADRSAALKREAEIKKLSRPAKMELIRRSA
jgi:putative endonuclease